MRYVRPLRFDDVVTVHLTLGAATRTTFQMAYLLTVDDTTAATGVTVHGMVNANGRPIRLPAWLVELGGSGTAPGEERVTPTLRAPLCDADRVHASVINSQRRTDSRRPRRWRP